MYTYYTYADDKYVWTPGVEETNYYKWYKDSVHNKTGFFPIDVQTGESAPKYEPFVIVRRIESNGVCVHVWMCGCVDVYMC